MSISRVCLVLVELSVFVLLVLAGLYSPHADGGWLAGGAAEQTGAASPTDGSAQGWFTVL